MLRRWSLLGSVQQTLESSHPITLRFGSAMRTHAQHEQATELFKGLQRHGCSTQRLRYLWQVTLLRELRPRPQLERLEISSVDGFQGKCSAPRHPDVDRGLGGFCCREHTLSISDCRCVQGARRKRSSSRWCGPMTAELWAFFQTAGPLQLSVVSVS
jgi:hypothetical protein